MKKIITLSLWALFPLLSKAQNCETILTDSFSNASSWTHAGTANTVSVTGGVCSYNNTVDGVEDRIYRPLPATLSDNYWKAEFQFTINASNPSGNGSGATLIALTAGSLDPICYDASQSYALTNQDGIVMQFLSSSISDNNINDWQFIIISKKGATQVVATNFIDANSSIATYYVRLERLSASTIQVSVFTDPGFTLALNGSPYTVSIDPTITGLNYVQMGGITAGSQSREISGQTDNLNICNEQTVYYSCDPMITDSFSNPSLWTHAGTTNTVSVASSVCRYNNTIDGVEDRIYRPLPATLSDNYWKAEFRFTINASNPSGNGSGATLMALTGGSLDPICYDASQSYALTNQDGIIMEFLSSSISDNNINDWQFIIISKKGATQVVAPNFIDASSSIATYYVRLERLSVSTIQVSVFSDPGFTLALNGSPYTVSVDPTITGLNYVQMGGITAGNPARIISGQTDNLNICNGVISGVNSIRPSATSLNLYPNPSSDYIMLNWSGEPKEITVYSVDGRMVMQHPVNSSLKQLNMSINTLAPGYYIVGLRDINGTVERKSFIKD